MKIWRYARSAAKSGSTSSKTRKSACTSQWGRPTTRFSLMCSPRWARRIPVWSLSLSRRCCSVWKGARWGRSWRYRTWRERKINDIWNSNKDHIKWYFSLGNFIFSTLALNYLFVLFLILEQKSLKLVLKRRNGCFTCNDVKSYWELCILINGILRVLNS